MFVSPRRRLRRVSPAMLLSALSVLLASHAGAQVCVNQAGPIEFGSIGDINGSGDLNVADAVCSLLVTTWYSGGQSGPEPDCVFSSWPHSDLTCDGSVEVGDVQLVVQLALHGEFLEAVDSEGDGCPDTCMVCENSLENSCLHPLACVAEGDDHPLDACVVCAGGTPVGSFEPAVDGTACGPDLQCFSGSCLPFGPPGPPVVLVATSGEFGLYVSFDPPQYGGVADSYVAECTSTNGGATLTGSSPTGPVILQGGTLGANYTCIARGVNTSGAGVWSDPSNELHYDPVRASCLAHFDVGQLDDGAYLIDPDGGFSGAAFRAYCDMTTDGGGWTLFATGIDFPGGGTALSLTNPASGLTEVLEPVRAMALVDQSTHLFRIADTTGSYTLFIQDADPYYASVGGGLGHDHVWATAAASVQCATAYAQVTAGTMNTTSIKNVTCDPDAIGSHICGFPNGWLLLHSGDTYNGDGTHPCPVPAPASALRVRWVR